MTTSDEKTIFGRTSLLLGPDGLEACSEARVIIFGVGGVGSWCAEGLVRSGIKHLTLVDPDKVNPTNINRQLEATTKTIGQPKVEALKARLQEINPDAQIITLQAAYNDEDFDDFDFDAYHYVIDAIDSLKDKISLLLRASCSHAKIYSSMGAALKVDPTKIKVAEFWDVRGCPLGSMMRKRMRQAKTFPHKNIYCVYDEEVMDNKGEAPAPAEDNPMESKKAVTNGSTAPITAIFGMTLAGLVIKDITSKNS
ncbi:MAG: tRNA threonylcarbamoyladenosine dehydratase [Bacteroidales bacterium]|nr:tRNA threonylcarbamoyladenosine dehydratase [Bacteroidales bacterium]